MQGFWNLIGKSGTGLGKDFAYDIGERVNSPCDDKSVWTLHHGKHKVTGAIASVFICDSKTVTPEEFHLAKSAYKRLRTLRHPNIIKFLDGFESEVIVYLVTEAVVPLVMFIDEDDGRNANLIKWGLHQTATGLSFLVNDCKLTHENINIFSVFVGVDGEWKLGGVEYLHATNTDPVAKLPALTCYNIPEGKRTQNKEWAVDAWGLGCLVWEIYNGAMYSSLDLKIINKLPKSLVVHYSELVCANPRKRTNPAQFLEKCQAPGNFFDSDFIAANKFMQEIQIKSIEDQKKFYLSLDKKLDGYPKQFCVHKVLPQLLNAFEFGAAGSAILSPLFKIGLYLDEASYQQKILPCIIKLFSSNDRATRIQLLQQLGKFVKHLQPHVVDNQIFSCVATGFGDTLPAMREQTVKAMLLLAPKLSEKTINNQLLRYFAKLQMDEQPGIRTNTTVCLGKIAPHMSDETRKKVLASAFSRALRDPFPHARSAGIMALSATREFYAMTDVAQKILPALCAMTVDAERSVRDHAFTLIKEFLKDLETYSKDENNALNNKEVSEKEAGQQSTWTGWAVSSLTSKFYQQQQQQQHTQQQQLSQQHQQPNQQQQPTEPVEQSNKQAFQQKPFEEKAKVNTTSYAHQKYDNDENIDDDDDKSDYGDGGDDWSNDNWRDDTFTQSSQNHVPPKTSMSQTTSEKTSTSQKTSMSLKSRQADDGWKDDWTDENNDGWGVVDDWEAPKDLSTGVKKESGMMSSKKNSQTDNWTNDDGWGNADEWGGTPQDSHQQVAAATTADEWKDNDGWDADEGWGGDDYFSQTSQSKGEKKSVAEMLGMTNNLNGGDFLTGSQADSLSNKPFADSSVNKVVSKDDQDDDEAKKARKLELEKKRREKRLQREKANKEKRDGKASSGAMKLGGIKKG